MDTTKRTHLHSLNFDKMKIQKDECIKYNEDWNTNFVFKINPVTIYLMRIYFVNNRSYTANYTTKRKNIMKQIRKSRKI